MKKFLSGDEAFADGIRLAKPAIISPLLRKLSLWNGFRKW